MMRIGLGIWRKRELAGVQKNSNSLIAVTRSSPSTCIGPDGTVQWGPHNLAPESNSLLGWSSSLTANSTPFSVAAFDGGMYGLTANSVAGSTNFSTNFTANDTKICLFVDVKRGNFDTGNGCHTYGFYNATTAADICYITVNYLTGAVALTGPQSATATAYTTTLANGWFRIGIKVTAGVNPGNNVYAYLGGVGSATSSGFYWYMARVHVLNGDKTAYVDSTVGNRLGYSNDFTNAAWTKTNVSVQANSCTGPTSQPAHTLTASSANGTVSQSLTLSGVYTAGLMIRRRTGSGAISIRKSDASAYVAQTITTSWALISNDSGTSGGTAYCAIQMATSGDQIDVCDARLVPGSSAATYVYNQSAAPTVGPIYSGRTDYDPVTLASKGTLIEEARTNLLLNSASPATQTVTVTTQSYTISFWGTGTCVLTGTASGTLTGTGANVRSTLTVSATAGAVLCTFSGSTTNGQVEAGLNATSYIPTAGATVTRTADTALIGFDNLAQVWPWVMDANLLVSPEALDNASWVKPTLTVSPNALTAPDGTQTMDKLIPPTSSAEQYFEQTITPAAGTWTLFCKAAVPAGYNWVVIKPIHVGDTGDTSEVRYNMVTGAWNISSKNRITTYDASQNSDGSWFVYATFTTTASCTSLRGRINLSIDGTTTVFAGDGVSGIGVWGVKLNPGPIAQTYYPNSVKQATIVVEGDLTYGATSAAMAVMSLENTASNQIKLSKGSSTSQLSGFINANSATPGSLTSGTAFKAAIGYSPSSAGVVLNASSESSITSGAFTTPPNVLKLGNDAGGNVASAMHVKNLRLFNSNLPASDKRVLTT